MDISRFDTREKAHEGVSVPLVIDGETEMGHDGEPVTFRIKGLADPAVHRIILSMRRDESRTPAEVLASDMKLAHAAVIGWSSNWTLGGEALEFSRANVEKVFAIPLIRRAILAEVADDAHFMNRD